MHWCLAPSSFRGVTTGGLEPPEGVAGIRGAEPREKICRGSRAVAPKLEEEWTIRPPPEFKEAPVAYFGGTSLVIVAFTLYSGAKYIRGAGRVAENAISSRATLWPFLPPRKGAGNFRASPPRAFSLDKDPIAGAGPSGEGLWEGIF
jgi:hypothetical protein